MVPPTQPPSFVWHGGGRPLHERQQQPHHVSAHCLLCIDSPRVVDQPLPAGPAGGKDGKGVGSIADGNAGGGG
jgi:hypothetical protein